MGIRRDGNRFYVEVFTPTHDWRFMGMVITINVPDSVPAFVTHIKNPSKHYYIKGHGYPINNELLRTLSNARVEYIIIPEDAKSGFTTYLVELSEYLNGETVSEPLTEQQRCIPLNSMQKVPMDYNKLRKLLYNKYDKT